MPVLKTDNADNGASTFSCDDAADLAIVVQQNNVDKAAVTGGGTVKAVLIDGIVAATGVKVGDTASKVGFFGVTPVVKPLLATGGGATADNIITVLQSLGLVKQS